MSIKYICQKVDQLVKKHHTRDPFELCEREGILLRFDAMGKTPSACKGFFLYQSRIQVITINNDLPKTIQRIILAHELGHAILHKSQAKLGAFHDFSLYDTSSQFEYEANLFAAELLLKDEQVFELLNEDKFFFAAASELYVPPELLDFKFRILKNKGYQIVDPPLIAKADFLKKCFKHK